MGLTKHEVFSESQNALALYLKAMGHPARIAILQQLVKEDRCVCGDLVDVLPLAQATVSQHLSELKKAGLIKGTISGTSMCYCLDKESWEKCIAMLDDLISEVKKLASCC